MFKTILFFITSITLTVGINATERKVECEPPPPSLMYKNGFLSDGILCEFPHHLGVISILSDGKKRRYIKINKDVFVVNLTKITEGSWTGRIYGVYNPGDGLYRMRGEKYSLFYCEDYFNHDSIESANKELLECSENRLKKSYPLRNVGVTSSGISYVGDFAAGIKRISIFIRKNLVNWKEHNFAESIEDTKIVKITKFQNVNEVLLQWRKEKVTFHNTSFFNIIF